MNDNDDDCLSIDINYIDYNNLSINNEYNDEAITIIGKNNDDILCISHYENECIDLKHKLIFIEK